MPVPHTHRSTTSHPTVRRHLADAGPRDRPRSSQDDDLLEAVIDASEPASLDFDDAYESRTLHEHEPDSDFDTLDDRVTPFVDVSDTTDALYDSDRDSGLDLFDDDPL